MKKVALFCYDYWLYGKQIADKAQQKNVDITYINPLQIKYQYSSLLERGKNAVNKVLFNKNIKNTYRITHTYELIDELPYQDLILVINPYYFTEEMIARMKSKTKKLISYSFDSIERIPFSMEKRAYFDKMYSFDYKNTLENKDFIHLPNFNYFEKSNEIHEIKNKVFMVLSECNERIPILKKITDHLLKNGVKNLEFIVHSYKGRKFHPAFTTIRKPISLKEIEDKVKVSEILIDLVREQQSGLSFRVFEAMALEKKLITNNKNIKLYDFYNPNNILVIENDYSVITKEFLDGKYQPLPNEIFHKYTLDHWIDVVFEL